MNFSYWWAQYNTSSAIHQQRQSWIIHRHIDFLIFCLNYIHYLIIFCLLEPNGSWHGVGLCLAPACWFGVLATLRLGESLPSSVSQNLREGLIPCLLDGDCFLFESSSGYLYCRWRTAFSHQCAVMSQVASNDARLETSIPKGSSYTMFLEPPIHEDMKSTGGHHEPLWIYSRIQLFSISV